MKWLSPTGVTWIAAHLVMVLLGVICLLHGSRVEGQAAFAFWQGLGGSLIATGVAGEVLFLYVRANESLAKRMDIYIHSGLVALFKVRSVQIKAEYDNRLRHAREIDIMGFGLSSLRQDYSSQFVEWSRKARVRILLLDPDFPSVGLSIADQRDREEGNPVGQIRTDVNAFLEAVRQTPNLDPARFQVRLMRCTPSINMFRIDDEMFWGPYLSGEQSRNIPTMIIARHGFLYPAFQKHFEFIWAHSTFSVPS